MKKQTKLLLGAGAALGVGYLLFKEGGPFAGLGAAASDFTPEELAEFNEFDSFYAMELGLRDDYGDVLAAIAQRRGKTLTESQQDAAYAAAVLAGMAPAGCGTLANRCASIESRVAYYAPFIAQSLTDLGLAGGGESSGGECPEGKVPALGIDGKVTCVSVNLGPGDTAAADTYHTRDLGDPCERSSDCVGALLCRSSKCVAPKTSAGASAPAGSGVPTTTDPAAGAAAKAFTGDTSAKDAEPASVAAGMGLSTWLLVGGAAAAVYFLLKTDDTKVTRLREVGAGKAREYGAAAKKRLAAEYEKRFARGAGVNGLRRVGRARR